LIWTNADGTNDSVGYVPGALTDSVYYRRIVYDGIIPRDTSNVVPIIVHPRLNNNLISPDSTVCSGLTANSLYAPVAMTGALGPGSYAYSWEQSVNNSTWIPATGINDSIVYPTPTLTDTIYYRRQVSSGACTDTSNSVKISVLGPLLGNVISADQIICYNQSFDTLFTGAVSGGEPNDRIYKWQQNNTGSWIDTVASAGFIPWFLRIPPDTAGLLYQV